MRSTTSDWVEEDGPGGGLEYQLDILMFAKEMAPQATPGLYIALATDEDSDSEDPQQHNPPLYRTTVASALTQAGCIVFIDPTNEMADDGITPLSTYYSSLAVNGGSIETSLGTFTFPLMRQAILGAA